MNWDAIGASAEFAGAVGVVASLLYVATQVRYSNRASTVQAKLETTRFMTDYADLMLENPNLNDVMLRGQKSLDSLSSEEVWQFVHLSTKAFWFFSAGHFQFRQGTLPESEWHELRSVAHFWLSGKGCRDWWRTVGRPMFGSEFVAFIDAEIETLAAGQGAAADEPRLA
jgi:hypothetical protein